MKKFFSNLYSNVKVLSFIAIVALSFYSGMYVVSSGYEGNQKEIMGEAIKKAFASTEDQPIIVIVPNYSVTEKVKMLVGIKVPDREVIEISTNASTRAVFGKEIEPNFFQTAYTATTETIAKGWDATKNGTSKAWDATSGFVVDQWEKITD